MNKLNKILSSKKNLTKEIQDVFKEKRYAFFDLRKPFNVNLIFVRNTSDLHSAKFNDVCILIYSDFNKIIHEDIFDATVDPGMYYRENPLNHKGCGVIAPGQYRNSLKIGMHRGYQALIHTGEIMIYRDNNKDGKIDFVNPQPSINEGFNVHGTRKNLEVENVGKFSAGCQVIKTWDYFEKLMRTVQISAGIYGDGFTRTILESKDLGV